MEAKSKGYAKLINEEAVTDDSGEADFSVEGYAVGQGAVTLSVVGSAIQKDITVNVTHDNAIYIPDAPVININGESYRGQDNSITVAKGTKVTIVGDESNQYFYSIGEDSCPCEASEQVRMLRLSLHQIQDMKQKV